MKRNIFSLLFLVMAVVVFGSWSWATCPEAPTDNGICDTLRVTTPDAVQAGAGPYTVRFPLWITHDVLNPVDSIAAIVIPLCFTHTNPAKYCSVSAYWNSVLWTTSGRLRSVFRHLVIGTDTTHNWMMDLFNAELGEEWNTIILDFTSGTPNHFWLSMVPTSSEDPRFGPGNHVLMAMMTMAIQDTMHVTIDSCLWPPTSQLAFARSDAATYIPRDNMPATFWIGPPRLQVLSPNGGENWAQGSSHNITWLAENFAGGTVKIEYSTNSGTNWTTVIASTANNGSYTWNPIPNTPSTNCLVRVSNTVGGTPVDQSDAVFEITAPDFSIAATPDTQTVVAGDSTNYTVNLGALNGFSNPVTLSMNVIGSSIGISSVFSTNPVTPPGSSTMKVRTTGDTAPATYKLIVTGTYNSLVHKDTVTLIVTPAPNFTINATPDTQTVLVGDSTNYTVNLGALNGFSNPVTLSMSVIGSFVGITSDFSSNPVTPPGSSTMKVRTTGATAPATYKLIVTGTYSSLVHKDTVTLIVNPVPDFTITVNPDTQEVQVGNSINYDVHLTSLNGFSSPCTLTVSGLPTGASTIFAPNPMTPTNTSIMTVSTIGATPPGDYALTVTATQLSKTPIQHSAQIILRVEMAVNPDTLEFQAGDTVKFDVDLSSLSGIVSSCTLTVTGLPPYCTYSFDPNPVFPPDTSILTINTGTATPGGTYEITIIATGLSGKGQVQYITHVVLIVHPAFDFALAVTPETLKVEIGEDSSYWVKLTTISGIGSQCSLSVSSFPANVTGNFNSHILTPNPTDSTLLNIMVSCNANTTITPFPLTITATELPPGGIQKTKQVYLSIVEGFWGFKFATSPDTQRAVVGDSAIYQILIRRTTCFTLACSLSLESGLPGGAACYFSPPVIPSSDSTSKLVVQSGTALAGIYQLIVKGVATAKGIKDTLFLVLDEPSDVETGLDNPNAPKTFTLFQNQPNPFNPITQISYYLPKASRAKLTVYNVLGQSVRVLYDGYQEAGMQTVTWDGRNSDGVELSSGIYFYRLQAGNFNQTKKMSLMK